MGYSSENSGNIINYPLLPGTNDEEYFETFKQAVTKFKEFGISHLVVSLGVDTFEHDHLGSFNLTAAIYERLSAYIIHKLDIPVLIIMEGGYNNDSLAENVVSFLRPFMLVINF
jgi:acetoin utilization deacetylase AcuC-like enzyme